MPLIGKWKIDKKGPCIYTLMEHINITVIMYVFRRKKYGMVIKYVI